MTEINGKIEALEQQDYYFVSERVDQEENEKIAREYVDEQLIINELTDATITISTPSPSHSSCRHCKRLEARIIELERRLERLENSQIVAQIEVRPLTNA